MFACISFPRVYECIMHEIIEVHYVYVPIDSLMDLLHLQANCIYGILEHILLKYKYLRLVFNFTVCAVCPNAYIFLSILQGIYAFSIFLSFYV